MAKTTRKTDTTTGAAKPASRRRTTTAAAAGGEKVTTRRRTSAQSEAGLVPVAAERRPTKAQRPAQAALAGEPTHDEIAVRAWSIYERRGGGDGHAASDWFQARTELLRERGLES